MSLTVEADGLFADQTIPLPTTTTAASVRFSLNTVILLPGFSLPIIATFTPYIGVASTLRKKQVVNNPLLLGGGEIICEPYNFTFVDTDYPFYLMRYVGYNRYNM